MIPVPSTKLTDQQFDIVIQRLYNFHTITGVAIVASIPVLTIIKAKIDYIIANTENGKNIAVSEINTHESVESPILEVSFSNRVTSPDNEMYTKLVEELFSTIKSLIEFGFLGIESVCLANIDQAYIGKPQKDFSPGSFDVIMKYPNVKQTTSNH